MTMKLRAGWSPLSPAPLMLWVLPTTGKCFLVGVYGCGVCVCMSLCVYVCDWVLCVLCVCVALCACVWLCHCVCMCHCVCVWCVMSPCVWLCVCVVTVVSYLCVHVLNRAGSKVLFSRALVVVQTAVYLTGYSDYLTSLHEPFHHIINVTPVEKIWCDHWGIFFTCQVKWWRLADRVSNPRRSSNVPRTWSQRSASLSTSTLLAQTVCLKVSEQCSLFYTGWWGWRWVNNAHCIHTAWCFKVSE